MPWAREIRWNPSDRLWRTAWLFMVGSSLFALGSFPTYARLVDSRAVGVTFFLGSIFFTAAAYSQFRMATPRDLGWWAGIVQFVGTLMFNLSTGDALLSALDTQEANQLVWRPDIYGSIAFLVASHLAWMYFYGNHWRVVRSSADWWTSMLNYVGSIFFMLSAIAAYTLPTTGDVLNLGIVNSATFIGAVCFLLGAWLLLPPRERPV